MSAPTPCITRHDRHRSCDARYLTGCVDGKTQYLHHHIHGYGCLNTDFDYFDTVLPDDGVGASPGFFSYTLPSSFLGDVAIRYGLTGSSFVLQEKSARGLTCIKLALNAIACGDTDKMVCGICNPEQPPVFNNINRIPAGALFIAVERKAANGFSYGKMNLDKAVCITLNGEKINDMNALVRQCLAFP
jgi:3-oxoacyl-[acyl-carrier-protein] synthase II